MTDYLRTFMDKQFGLGRSTGGNPVLVAGDRRLTSRP